MRGMHFACIAVLAASCHLVSGVHELVYESGGAGGGPAPGENGAPCAAAGECHSSYCVDGVCCESACDASCSSCALDGKKGICGLHATGTDPDAECTTGSCDASGTCVGGNVQFGRTIGNVDINDMAVRSDGQFFVVGAFTGQADLGDGDIVDSTGQGQNMVIARYSNQGDLVWKKHFGSSGQDSAEGVAVDAQGDVWVTGHIEDAVDFGGGPKAPQFVGAAVFVARFDAGGTHERSDIYDTVEFETGLDIEATADAVFVFGRHDGGHFPMGPTGNDDPYGGLFLARLNLEGTPEWNLSFSGDIQAAQLDGRQRLAVTPSGDCAIVGGFRDRLEFGTDVWTGQANATDGYLARVDANGNPRWSKHFLMSIPDAATPHPDVAMDDLGNVFVTGEFFGATNLGSGELEAEGLSDIFVAAFDPEGNPTWSKRFGNDAAQEGRAIAVDAEGTLVVAGKAQGAFDFGGGPLSAKAEDLFLLRLAADGTHLFSAFYGDVQDQMGEALTVHARSAFIAGYCEGAIDFGLGAQTCTPGAFFAGFGP